MEGKLRACFGRVFRPGVAIQCLIALAYVVLASGCFGGFKEVVSSERLDYRLKYGVVGFLSPEEANNRVSVIRYIPANVIVVDQGQVYVERNARASVYDADNRDRKADLVFTEIFSEVTGGVSSDYFMVSDELTIEEAKKYQLSVTLDGKTYESAPVRVPKNISDFHVEHLFTRKEPLSDEERVDWFVRVKWDLVPGEFFYRIVLHAIREDIFSPEEGIYVEGEDPEEEVVILEADTTYNVYNFGRDEYIDVRGQEISSVSRDIRILSLPVGDTLKIHRLHFTVVVCDENYYNYHFLLSDGRIGGGINPFGEPAVLPENLPAEFQKDGEVSGIVGSYRLFHKVFYVKDLKVLD
ncbi:MAG: DUF4249 family protein [Cytophagales bacterium]|nr:DUF4249 family protein [Cytophagales bacterium]